METMAAQTELTIQYQYIL